MVGRIKTSWERCIIGTWRNLCPFIHLSPQHPCPSPPSPPLSLLSQTQSFPTPLSYLPSFSALTTILNYMSDVYSLITHLFAYRLYPHQTLSSMRSGSVSVCTLQSRDWHRAGIKIAEVKNEPVHWTYIYQMPSVEAQRVRRWWSHNCHSWEFTTGPQWARSFERNE